MRDIDAKIPLDIRTWDVVTYLFIHSLRHDDFQVKEVLQQNADHHEDTKMYREQKVFIATQKPRR